MERTRDAHFRPIGLLYGDLMRNQISCPSLPTHEDWITRTFPDCMMTFVFGWGKTDIQEEFRRAEIANMTDEQMQATRDNIELSIADYQVSSAERFKRFNNKAHASQIYTAHSWSTSEARLRIERGTISEPRSTSRARRGRCRRQHGSHVWKDYNSTWKEYGDYSSQSDSSDHWHKQR